MRRVLISVALLLVSLIQVQSGARAALVPYNLALSVTTGQSAMGFVGENIFVDVFANNVPAKYHVGLMDSTAKVYGEVVLDATGSQTYFEFKVSSDHPATVLIRGYVQAYVASGGTWVKDPSVGLAVTTYLSLTFGAVSLKPLTSTTLKIRQDFKLQATLTPAHLEPGFLLMFTANPAGKTFDCAAGVTSCVLTWSGDKKAQKLIFYASLAAWTGTRVINSDDEYVTRQAKEWTVTLLSNGKRNLSVQSGTKVTLSAATDHALPPSHPLYFVDVSNASQPKGLGTSCTTGKQCKLSVTARTPGTHCIEAEVKGDTSKGEPKFLGVSDQVTVKISAKEPAAVFKPTLPQLSRATIPVYLPSYLPNFGQTVYPAVSSSTAETHTRSI
jgi:hypothetical protein